MKNKPLSTSFLEDYYTGDPAWKHYVSMCEEEFPRFRQEQPQLLDLVDGHYDLAIVIFQKTGDSATAWVKQKVPALNGLSPIDCLAEPHLVKRLKECLLRMP